MTETKSDNSKAKIYAKICDSQRRSRLLPIVLGVLLVLLGLQALPSIVLPAHAATPTVFVAPASQPLAASGSAVTVNVNVTSMPTFDAWDILVKADPTIINGTTISTANSILTGTIPLVNCINGAGTNCSPTTGDGMGVVHSAVFGAGTSASGNGILFTITYKAINGPGSLVTISNDHVSTPTGADIPHTTVNGVYGSLPDFSISATPISPSSIPQGSVASSTVSLASINAFSGTVTVTSVISGPAGTPPALSPASNPIVLTAGGTGMFTLTISTTASTTLGTYTVRVTGTASSAGPHSVTPDLTVTVTPPAADFSFTPAPGGIMVPAGATGTSTISLTGVNGFSGTVLLTVVSGLPNGAKATFSNPNPVPLTATATSTLTVTTDALLTLPGSYTITVMGVGTSGTFTPSHTTTVSLTITPPPTFSSGKVHWTHHLSLSAHSPANVQTWTAVITNPDTVNPVNIEVVIHYTLCLVPCTLPHDIVLTTTLGAGVTVTPTLNSGDLSAFVNNKLCFTATLLYGPGLTGTSPATKSGCFAIIQ